MEGVSYTAESQAQTQLQASVIALRESANTERQIAQAVSQQAEQASQPAPARNPEHLGQNVDTHA